MLISLTGMQLTNAQPCSESSASLSSFNNQNNTQTIFANNNISIGGSRITVTHPFGSSRLSTDRISDTHYPGESAINLGHTGNVNSYDERIETRLTFNNAVRDFKFTINDLDAGDRIRVIAYDLAGNIVPIVSSNYSFYPNTIVSYHTPSSTNGSTGEFRSLLNDIDSGTDGQRRATIDFTFAGIYITKIEFVYYDVSSAGSYSITKFSGVSAATCPPCTPAASAPVITTNANYSEVNSSYNIPCGSTTANLSSLTTNPAIPSGSTLTWHTNTPATDANRIINTTTVAGTVKVYAAFRTSAGCYSSTKEITVYVPICVQDDDFTSIPIIKGQGITLPSLFTNDSFNGGAFTLANPNVSFIGDLWTPSNAIVNNNGTITVPANNTFVVGTSPSYIYKICDQSSNAVLDSSCKTGVVTFKIICASGTVAPTVQPNISNSCPTTTVNLNNAHTGTIPNTTELIWYTNNTHTGSQLTASQVSAAGAGTYYAFYFSSAGNCFSPASNPIVVTISNCNGCSDNNLNLAPYANQTNTSSVFSANNVRLGNNAITLSHNTPLPANFSTDVISDTHYAGEFGIQLGHNKSNGLASNERIQTQMTFATPLKNLKFTISDLDLGDNVIINAYDAANNLITINSANYFIHNTTNISNSGNRFYPPDPLFQSASNTRNGSVDLNFTNQYVSKVVFEFYDTEYTGSYSITRISGEVCSTYCTKPGVGGTPDGYSKIGITVQQKQNNWPENIPNGFIAMESKEKGFVITRVQNSAVIVDAKQGMLIYDIDAQCVKLYNGSIWKCLSRSCNDTL